MSIDLDAVRAASSRRSQPDHHGVDNMLRRLHSDPELADWITLQTTTLAPIPARDDGGWTVTTLLAVQGPHPETLLPPWGLVTWRLPSGETLRKGRLADDAREDASASEWKLPSLSGTASDVATARTAAWRKLCGALDRLADGDARLEMLLPFYAELLPRAAYPLYHRLVPSSAAWLRPAEPPVSDGLTVSPQTHHSPASIDLSLDEGLGPWLRQAEALAKETGNDLLTDRMAQIRARRQMPGFRLAIVGEISRGKSTLLNGLLGRPGLLPTGGVTTTAAPVSIIAGESDRMEIEKSGGALEQRTLEPSSWDDLVAAASAYDDRSSETRIRLSIDEAWLRRLDLELVDTPASDSLEERRAAICFDILMLADAAIVVIAATSPLSLTERSLIEAVLERGVPCAIAITKLDLVPAPERDLVVESIARKAAEISSAVQVVRIETADNVADMGPLRRAIGELAAGGRRRFMRDCQVAMRLAAALREVADIARSQQEIALLAVEERRARRRAIEARAEKRAHEWDRLRFEFQKRRQKLADRFRERVESEGAGIIERLAREISHAPDPGNWWNQDSAYRLRTELTALANSFEEELWQAVVTDLRWLDEGVARLSPSRSADMGGRGAWSVGRTIEPETRDVRVTDLQRFQLATRLGSGALILGSALFLGPAAIAVSICSAVAGERLVRRRADADRPVLKAEITRAVNRALSGYIAEASARLKSFYAEIAEATGRNQEAAVQAGLTEPTGAIEVAWASIGARATQLAKAIEAALASAATEINRSRGEP